MGARYGLKDAVDTQLRYSMLIEMRKPIGKNLYLQSPLFRIARVFWHEIQDRLDGRYEFETSEGRDRDELERSFVERDL